MQIYTILMLRLLRVVYQVKKKGRKKRRLALVKTGPGGLKDALEVIQDDAVRRGVYRAILIIFCLLVVSSISLFRFTSLGFV